jgi:hypothetical protein
MTDHHLLACKFTRMVRAYSPNAAAELERIRDQYDARAAYFAAFAIERFREESERLAPSGRLPSRIKYGHYMKDYPDALPCFERALERFLVDREVGNYKQPKDRRFAF